MPGFDESLKDGNFVYHDVIEQKYWGLNLTNFKIKQKTSTTDDTECVEEDDFDYTKFL